MTLSGLASSFMIFWAARVSFVLSPAVQLLGAVGDRWSILILRELFMATSRFEDLLAQTDASQRCLPC